MSETKTLAGMNDAELAEAISSACKRHIPNIDLPLKYHVIVDALPMIYGEGMVKGHDFAESKFKEELAATKQQLAGSEAALKLALTRSQHDRKALEAAEQAIHNGTSDRAAFAVARLNELNKIDDPEGAHIAADGILCELLEQIGCADVVSAYKKVDKYF